MNCTNCQTQLNPGSSFCANCGTPVQAAAPAAPAAPAQPVVTPGAPYAPRPVASTNGLAIASLVVSIAAGLVSCGTLSFIGAILGHVALNQIKTSRQGGRGLAIGGIVTGWVITGIWVIVIAILIAAGAASNYGY